MIIDPKCGIRKVLGMSHSRKSPECVKRTHMLFIKTYYYFDVWIIWKESN